MSHSVTRKRIPTAHEAYQRHHDYYVTLERRGELGEGDREYELAMQREQLGQVKPIPEDMSDPSSQSDGSFDDTLGEL